MKIWRDAAGQIRVSVSAEDITRINRNFKLSPGLRQRIEEHRAATVQKALDGCRPVR